MRILTVRMNTAVTQFVSPQQNGFVPHGFIAENIMLLKLLQAYAEENGIEAYFLFLDMESLSLSDSHRFSTPRFVWTLTLNAPYCGRKN
jgi:hypothetical protein